MFIIHNYAISFFYTHLKRNHIVYFSRLVAASIQIIQYDMENREINVILYTFCVVGDFEGSLCMCDVFILANFFVHFVLFRSIHSIQVQGSFFLPLIYKALKFNRLFFQ